MSSSNTAWALMQALMAAILGPTKEDLPPAAPQQQGNPQAFFMDYFARQGKRERQENEAVEVAEALAEHKAWRSQKVAEAKAVSRQRSEARRETHASPTPSPRQRY